MKKLHLVEDQFEKSIIALHSSKLHDIEIKNQEMKTITSELQLLEKNFQYQIII